MAEKRKDRKYETTMVIGKKESGLPIIKHIYATSKTDLTRKKARIMADLKIGKFVSDENTTFLEYANRWLQTYKSSKEESTYNGYENIINNHVCNLHRKKLSEIILSDIQKAVNNSVGHWDIQRRIKLTVRQILDCAIDDGLIYKNVAKNVVVPNKPEKEYITLTDEDKEIIRNIDFKDREKAFVYIAMYTGMRPEEIRGLRKIDFDFKNRLIYVQRAEVFENSSTPRIKETKTKAGKRYLPIVDALMPVIKPYVEQCEDFLFVGNRTHEPFSKKSYYWFWQKISEKIMINTDIEGMTPYVFRHEFATTLYYAGIDLKEAKRLMGHSDIRMLLDVYAHLDEKKSATSSKLNKIFS